MKKFFILITSLLCSCAFLFGASKAVSDTFFTDVSVRQAEELIKNYTDNPNFIIIDVRSPSEYESGHIEEAVNINYYDSDFVAQLDKFDKEKTYLIYCRSGSRSSRALKTMKELGFKKIYHLKKGYNSWVNR